MIVVTDLEADKGSAAACRIMSWSAARGAERAAETAKFVIRIGRDDLAFELGLLILIPSTNTVGPMRRAKSFVELKAAAKRHNEETHVTHKSLAFPRHIRPLRGLWSEDFGRLAEARGRRTYAGCA